MTRLLHATQHSRHYSRRHLQCCLNRVKVDGKASIFCRFPTLNLSISLSNLFVDVYSSPTGTLTVHAQSCSRAQAPNGPIYPVGPPKVPVCRPAPITGMSSTQQTPSECTSFVPQKMSYYPSRDHKFRLSPGCYSPFSKAIERRGQATKSRCARETSEER